MPEINVTTGGIQGRTAIRCRLPFVQCRHGTRLPSLAAFMFPSVTAGPVTGMNAALQQAPASGLTLHLAATCEATRADANRVAAATLDILPCSQPHHVTAA